MQQTYHSNATTNINIRTQIQTVSATNSELAARFNVSQQTVSKWKNRGFAEDAPCAPHNINYALTDLEKALAISLRRSTWMPLDEVWEALLEVRKISRSSVPRCFVAGGINKVPREKRDTAKKFKAYNGVFTYRCDLPAKVRGAVTLPVRCHRQGDQGGFLSYL